MKKLIALSLAAAFASGCAPARVVPAPKAEALKPAPVAPPPETPPSELYAAAREKIAAKDFPSARLALDRFLDKQPKSAAGHFDAGWVSEQLGDKDAARSHYTKALLAEPEHLGAALNLARLYQLFERYDD